MSDDNTVGIIGLGLLGSALAERLLKASFRVVGFDLDASRCELFVGSGGEAVDSAQSVARQARRIIFSLPNSEIVQQVVEEIASLLRPGTVVVDTTTGDPEKMAALGRRLESLGVQYLDATIGGSSQQAREGDVIVMAGGHPAAFAACGDLFATFSRETFHVGPCGYGARMKLAVNLVLGLNRAALAEGLSFARAMGLDLGKTLEILRAGPAWSRAMDIKGIKMIEQDF
ncbi:MAG: NAD(P)-dependent oxidoreductase [Planctomycetaceae bacterium]